MFIYRALTFSCLEMATQEVVLSGKVVWAELVGFLGIVQEQLKNLLAAAKEATRAIVHLVGSVEVARENVYCVCTPSLF